MSPRDRERAVRIALAQDWQTLRDLQAVTGLWSTVGVRDIVRRISRTRCVFKRKDGRGHAYRLLPEARDVRVIG